jgi:hypothetical protein
MAATGPTTVGIAHPFLGELELVAGPGPDGTHPELLFCDNETNVVGSTASRGRATPKTASTTTSWRARRP